MGRFWHRGGDNSGGDVPGSARPDFGSPSLLTLIGFAAIIVGFALLAWAYHSTIRQIKTIQQTQATQLRRLDRVIADLEGEVSALPTDLPTPHVTVQERPGQTIVVFRSTSPSSPPKPSPSPSVTPTPSPSPSPTSTPFCVPKNKPHACIERSTK